MPRDIYSELHDNLVAEGHARTRYIRKAFRMLPGLDKLLRSDAAPFNRAPEVDRLGQRVPLTIKDLTEGMDYNLFALALSMTVGLPD